MKNHKNYLEEDVVKDRIDHLIEHRIPWLLLGLFGGFLVTIVVSGFESILSADVRMAFFIPIVVYLPSAIGIQTETIYIRELSERGHIHFLKYIIKESSIGFCLGIISGTILGLFSFLWLKSMAISFTLGITMVINLTLAPILAIVIPGILYKEHSDPALGSGPVATIVQDFISLLIYFVVAIFINF